MREAGVRELRDHLSRYLDVVQNGDAVTVTDRGRPVARLVPVDQERPFDRLVAEGVITPAVSRPRTRPTKRVKATGSVSELVAEQRR